MKKPIVNLVIILVIAALAVFIDIPREKGLKIGRLERTGNLYLGLDLQGGTSKIGRASCRERV